MLALLIMSSLALASGVENRCGWWDNTTPGNVDFIDKDKVWTVSVQGGQSAKGMWGPSGETEITNRVYGRNCVCIKAEINHKTGWVSRIHSGITKKLNDCYQDKALPGYEAPATGALKEFIGHWISTNEDCLPGSEYSIRPKHIAIGGDGRHDFKVVKESPLWIELSDVDASVEKFQRLTKKKNGQIVLDGSDKISEDPNGGQCILEKSKIPSGSSTSRATQ